MHLSPLPQSVQMHVGFWKYAMIFIDSMTQGSTHNSHRIRMHKLNEQECLKFKRSWSIRNEYVSSRMT